MLLLTPYLSQKLTTRIQPSFLLSQILQSSIFFVQDDFDGFDLENNQIEIYCKLPENLLIPDSCNKFTNFQRNLQRLKRNFKLKKKRGQDLPTNKHDQNFRSTNAGRPLDDDLHPFCVFTDTQGETIDNKNDALGKIFK